MIAMRHRIILSMIFLLEAGTATCLAQTDTLLGKWGAVVPTKVQSFSKNSLRAERPVFAEGDKVMRVNYTDLDAVRFSDGFEIRFRDGLLVRDNLLQAPYLRLSSMDVKVEGLLPLKQAELRQYYGDRNYALIYKPYRTLFVTGLGKLAGGALCFAVSSNLNKYRRISAVDTIYSTDEGVTTAYQVTVERGRLNPFWTTAAAFFVGTMVDGMVDCGVAQRGHKRLFYHPDSVPLPSASTSKGLLWGGAALSAAGLGALAISFSELQAHADWYVQTYVPVVPGENFRKGERPASWVLYTLLGGAVATNLGFSAIQLGAMRLSAIHRIDGEPHALQVHVGPTPSGYGLAARF